MSDVLRQPLKRPDQPLMQVIFQASGATDGTGVSSQSTVVTLKPHS